LCGDLLEPGVLRCPRDGALLGDGPDPWVGAILAGRYRLVARIGRGGMSSVYLARHTVIDRLAAVKILRTELSHDPIHRDRFLREARAVNRIQHENIIDITDYGETSEGVVFLVMEFVPGESLLSALARGPLAPLRALHVARQIATGLGRAHQMNVVHRDLKPDNVLLVHRDDGTDLVKVLDFGIAKLLDAPALTQANKVFGTPGYIAPEYAMGGALTPRSDLYSLGVVLYETVTGSLPFDSEHVGELMLKHVLEPPVPPRSRVPSLPEGFEQLILRLLAKKPEARYTDAFHLIEALDALRDSLAHDPAAESVPSLPDHRTLFSLSSPIDIEGVPGRDEGEVPTRVRLSLRVPLPALVEDPWATPVDPQPDALRDWANEALDGLGTPDVAQRGSLPPTAGVLDLRVPSAEDPMALPGAWRNFLETARHRLPEMYWGEAPLGVSAALQRLESSVAIMEAAGDRVTRCRERLLGLEARGRDFRLSIGRALDGIAADLSLRARERDTAATRCTSLEAHRDALRGNPGSAAEADAVLWEMAACEEVLREAVHVCEDLEYQHAELGRQLDRLNETLEDDQRPLLDELTGHIEALVAASRTALDAVEALDASVS